MRRLLTLAAVVLAAPSAYAAQGVAFDEPGKSIPLPVAMTLAEATFAACKNEGEGVTVYVLDAAYDPVVVMRDRSPRHTIDAARRKAYTAIKMKMPTSAFAAQVGEWRPESHPKPGEARDYSVPPPGVNGDPDLFAGRGGVPVMKNGEVLAAVGVAGAPGGERDENCANMGLAAIKGMY